MMHHDAIEVSDDVVRHLISDQFPQWQEEPIERLATDGTTNSIFRIGESKAARFPLRFESPSIASVNIHRETSAMEEMASVCPFPTPRCLAIGKPGNDYPSPWMVQTWLSGEVADPTGLANSERFASDLAQLVLALRTAPVKGRRFSGDGRGGAITDSDGWMDTCFRESEGLLDVPRLRLLWDRFRTLPRTHEDAMTHGDLIPANLLVDDGRLDGVLDAGGFGPTDPALDLVAGWHLLDSDARATFRAKGAFEDVEWHRGAAWAFQQAMGLVWYYRISNPGMAHLGRTALARILRDPEFS